MQVNLKANDGRFVSMTIEQANAIKQLNATRKGGCASVKGYQPSTNWIDKPVQNIQFISRISTENLYKRKLKALEALTIQDVLPLAAKHEKLAALSLEKACEIFDTRLASEIASLKKSLNGDSDDAHRQGHIRCYAMFGEIKVNLITEKQNDGLKHPVLTNDGSCQCAAIMVPYIELNVKTVKDGTRKVVNSGAPVLMGNVIAKVINNKSTVYKTLSLKADNFETLTIDRQEFTPEDVATFGDILDVA